MWNVCCSEVQSVVEVTSSGSAKRSATSATGSGRGAGGKACVRRIRDVREQSLSVSFPHKVGGYELKIIRQPEDQHRARYLTEGSRGTVKDKTQQSHPTIKVHFTLLHLQDMIVHSYACHYVKLLIVVVIIIIIIIIIQCTKALCRLRELCFFC